MENETPLIFTAFIIIIEEMIKCNMTTAWRSSSRLAPVLKHNKNKDYTKQQSQVTQHSNAKQGMKEEYRYWGWGWRDVRGSTFNNLNESLQVCASIWWHLYARLKKNH